MVERGSERALKKGTVSGARPGAALGTGRARMPLLVVGMTLALLAPAVAGEVFLTNVSVIGRPTAVAVDLLQNSAFVTNRDTNTVSVINGASNLVTANVQVGAFPSAIAVNPNPVASLNLHRVYAANLGGDSVSVIDAGTNAVVATVPLPAGSAPDGIAVNALTGKVYVANSGTDTVTVIDGATNLVVATVPVGDRPYGVAVHVPTNRVFVANFGSATVSVINGFTDTLLTAFATGLSPTGLAVHPITGHVFVSSFGSSTVSVHEGLTGVTLATVTGINSPHGIDINPIAGRVYVAPGSGPIKVIDALTHQVVASLPTSTGGPASWLATNPLSGRTFVALHDDHAVDVFQYP